MIHPSKCDQVYSLQTGKTHGFSKCIELQHLTPPNAFFSYLNKDDQKILIQNLILLVFKYFNYQ